VGSRLATPAQPLEVLLRADKTLLLTDRERGGAAVAVSRDELVARIRAKQAARPEQPVVIAADRSARYEDVLAILDVLQRNGAKKVGLLARPASN
jgi:biopolymer transport protein TolR